MDWGGIGEWNGPAQELDYDMIWDDSEEGKLIRA